MGDLFWLGERQMARISPFFPLAHGVPRVDDRRVVIGIGNGLQWKDAPKDYGQHKTLYNRRVQSHLRRLGGRRAEARADHDRRHLPEGSSLRRPTRLRSG